MNKIVPYETVLTNLDTLLCGREVSKDVVMALKLPPDIRTRVCFYRPYGIDPNTFESLYQRRTTTWKELVINADSVKSDSTEFVEMSDMFFSQAALNVSNSPTDLSYQKMIQSVDIVCVEVLTSTMLISYIVKHRYQRHGTFYLEDDYEKLIEFKLST